MSQNIEVYPTITKSICLQEFIECIAGFYCQILACDNPRFASKIDIYEVDKINHNVSVPQEVTATENAITVINYNNEGEILIFYSALTPIDIEFWKKEVRRNNRANNIYSKIVQNQEVGGYWIIKKTISQPKDLNPFFLSTAYALSSLTDGFLYSDDGVWDVEEVPFCINNDTR